MKNLFIILFLILFLNNCSKNEKIEIAVIEEDQIETQMIKAYKEGMVAFRDSQYLDAAKKFNEAEILFPQSEWASRSALMAAYAYYSQDYYLDTIAELERFIKIYPKHENLDYAYYLLGLSYYEQIVDETKDLDSIIKAKEYVAAGGTVDAIENKYKLTDEQRKNLTETL